MCERELETEQNCNILTPQSYGHNSVSFPFSCAAQPVVWGQPSLGHVPQSSIFSPTDRTSCAPSYIIVQHPLFFLRASQSHSFNPFTVKVILWYSSTGCTCYLHRCISYFDSSAGSEVNIQHKFICITQKIWYFCYTLYLLNKDVKIIHT